ncbi:hypothetical protein [Halorhabdus amylolytica]|uniref:hypothetical protein n=1 Tax=Halorhabdus amylolytica TaxID=2559573 RepID=UPI001B7D7C20|nr:hypothetical protein [Halorhabdus amylolytica]
MSDVAEGIEGVIALIVGGFVLLLMGSSVQSSSVIHNLNIFGIFLILLGVVFAIALVAAFIGGLSGR